MAATEHASSTDKGVYSPDSQRKLYKGFMDFGFGISLPLGGAIAVYVALVLMGMSWWVTAPFWAIVVGIALRIFAKAFFMGEH